MTKFAIIVPALLGWLSVASPALAQESDATLYERMCSSCHSLNPGALAMQGPHLRGVFGRKAGTVRGYTYSSAVRNSGAVWNEIAMFTYLSDPTRYLEGTKKRTGINDGKALNRVIKFLQSTQSARVNP